MDKVSFIFRWVQRSGLMLKHKDLNPEQILDFYDQEAVECNCRGGDCLGWEVRQKWPPEPRLQVSSES